MAKLLLSWQTYYFHGKNITFMAKYYFHGKNITFMAKLLLSWQKYY